MHVTRKPGGLAFARAAAAAALLAATAIAPAAALAQSDGEVQEISRGIFRVIAEPYDVIVQVLPSRPAAGTVHFVVTPTVAATGEPVTDAVVLIVVDDEEGVPTYQSLAVSTLDQPSQYRANLLIKRAGEWTARVELDAGQGQAQLRVPLPVIDRSITGGLAGTLAFFAVFAVLVGGGIYIAMQARRKGRGRTPS